VVTPAQRELMPMFKNMLAVTPKDREHSQWNFGNPVTFSDKARPPQKSGGAQNIQVSH
jgi:hypothetical protein